MSDIGTAVITSAGRDLAAELSPADWPVDVKRWALVVGISKYQHSPLDLLWAARDAQQFADLLQSPLGGSFDPARVKVLVDEDATTANVIRALRSFLKRPASDDLVILYFACHGAPDPDRPGNLYLITHDTDPTDVAGTAVPMREVELCIQRDNLLARRVVLLADTCHSAALGTGRRSATDDAAALHRFYLDRLGGAKEGLAVLTSAEASETAQEDARWGGGHGVFTHFLLQGLRGDADGALQPPDGVVTVGELFEYVRQEVRRETGDQQHPVAAGTFDRELPLSVTGSQSMKAQMEVACALEEIALRLEEPARHHAAAVAFADALRLAETAGVPLPEAELGLARALLGAGRHVNAAEVLEQVVARGGSERSGALPLLALARWKCGDNVAARAALARVVAESGDEERVAWVRAHLAAGRTDGRRRALLVGIDSYRLGGSMQLRGCVNDVSRLKKVLETSCGFLPENVVTLVDEAATHRGVEAAFEDLASASAANDTVVVLFSGHSVPDRDRRPDDWDLYLILHDTRMRKGKRAGGMLDPSTSVSAARLHELMSAIPAERKTLLLDTHPNEELVGLAREGGAYAVLLASHADEYTMEIQLESEGTLGYGGPFSWAVSRRLAQGNPEALTLGQLVDGAFDEIRKRGIEQTPQLVGDRDRPVFGDEDLFLQLFDMTQRRTFPALSGDVLEARRARLAHARVTFPAANAAIGRALLEKGRYTSAAEALQRALGESGGSLPGRVAVDLARAHVALRRPSEAAGALRLVSTTEPQPDLGELLQDLTALSAAPRRALVVGVDTYVVSELPPVSGAEADAKAFKAALVDCAGFRDADVALLVGNEATREAMAEAWLKVVSDAARGVAVLYFAGNGSVDARLSPQLVPSDGRTPGVADLPVAWFARQAADCEVVGVFDAGWMTHTGTSGQRTAPPAPAAERVTDANEGTAAPDSVESLFRVGIWARPPQRTFVAWADAPPLEGPRLGRLPGAAGSSHGRLTYDLVTRLRELAGEAMTYAAWCGKGSAADQEGPTLTGPDAGQPVFEPVRSSEAVRDRLARLERAPVRLAAERLRAAVQRRERRGVSDPAGWLHYGIALGLAGDASGAVEALNHALDAYGDPNQRRRDPAADEHEREANYQLGRVLLDADVNHSRAVSALNAAVRTDPGDARAQFYLASAIRAMVARETLAKAVDAYRAYLAGGAPLGQEREVRQFLAERSSERR